MSEIRNDWSRDEVTEIFHLPLLDLVYRAATVHRGHHSAREVQKCALLSIKTGGCSEDCKYCSQSSRYDTGIGSERMASLDTVLQAATRAKAQGATRFCMGAAWRSQPDGRAFERILEMVRGVKDLGMEVCCTLGMLTAEQAHKLKEAGLYAYNHNLDTSERYYPEVISTRTYQDRLETIKHAREAGLSTCCGGILGLGEDDDDRIDLLHTLATLPQHPESVPVNTLVPIEGTPLAGSDTVPFDTRLRFIATARILMPAAMVRLSAGRTQLTEAEQALCFLAGANAIWVTEKLLTTDNCSAGDDAELFDALDLYGKPGACNREASCC